MSAESKLLLLPPDEEEAGEVAGSSRWRIPNVSYPSASPFSSLNDTTFTREVLEKATGNFSDENRIGKGGFGSVYRGLLHGTPIAIKKLHEKGSAADFELEVSVLSKLRHPNIVLLMGFCSESFCIVSEFLPGGSLDDCLNSSSSNWHPLNWKDRLRIISEISTGLLFMHGNNILHRDLKPANILLTEHKVAKLADMGLAKLFDSSFVNTQVKGTFGYLDPHQIATGKLQKPSDVYAFGLIMLQLLTGDRSIVEIHGKLRNSDPFGEELEISEAATVFLNSLDRSAGDWNKKYAREVIDLALMCSARAPNKRPSLENHLQPELVRIHRAVQAEQGPVSIPAGTSFPAVPQQQQQQQQQRPEVRDGRTFERMNLMMRRMQEMDSMGSMEFSNSLMSVPMALDSCEQRETHSKRSLRKPVGSPVAKPAPSPVAKQTSSRSMFDWLGKSSSKSVDLAKEFAVKKEQGNKHFRSREFNQALASFEAAIELLPAGHMERAALHGNRAACFLELNEFREAITECDTALGIDSSSVRIWLRRAKALQKIGNTGDAMASISKALQMDPSNADALSMLNKLNSGDSGSSQSHSGSFGSSSDSISCQK